MATLLLGEKCSGATCVTISWVTVFRQETFSYPFHLPAWKCCIPVRVTHPCQIFKPFLLHFLPPMLLALFGWERHATCKKIKETAPVLLMSSTQLHENSITEHPPPSPSAIITDRTKQSWVQDAELLPSLSLRVKKSAYQYHRQRSSYMLGAGAIQH